MSSYHHLGVARRLDILLYHTRRFDHLHKIYYFENIFLIKNRTTKITSRVGPFGYFDDSDGNGMILVLCSEHVADFSDEFIRNLVLVGQISMLIRYHQHC